MTATRQALAELVRFLDAPPQHGCPHCSFRPTSLSDFCDAHRPGRKKEVIDAARAALEASVEPSEFSREDFLSLQGASAHQAVLFRKLQTRHNAVAAESREWKERFKKLGGHRTIKTVDRLSTEIGALKDELRKLRAQAEPASTPSPSPSPSPSSGAGE